VGRFVHSVRSLEIVISWMCNYTRASYHTHIIIAMLHASAMLYLRLFWNAAAVFLLFSAANLCGRSVDHHQILTRLMVTRVYEIGPKIWTPFPKKFGGPKAYKFGPNFWQLPNLMANISRMKRDIVERKMALQTATSPAHGPCLMGGRHQPGRCIRPNAET